MAVSGKNIVLTDSYGLEIYLPATSLENVGDKADVKAVPASTDYIALMDSASNGQMKKALVSTLKKAIGLEKVNNTSDADKPLSNAQKTVISKLSNPNLLDNWYFADPINQRGYAKNTDASLSTGHHAIDRWKIENRITMRLEDGGLRIINPSDSDGSAFIQNVPDHVIVLGTTYTLSCLIDEISGTSYILSLEDVGNPWAGYIMVRNITTPGLFTGTGKVNAISSQIGLLRVKITLAAHTSILIRAVKFETGSRQTLAHQDASGNWILNDPPPNKALELAKCQRYFQRFASEAMRPVHGEDFRPPMRTATPTLGTITVDGTTYYTASSDL